MNKQKYPLMSEEEMKEWKNYRRHLGRLMGEIRYKMKREGRNEADIFLLEILSTYHKMLGIYLKGDLEAYLRTHGDDDTYARRIRKYLGSISAWLSFLMLFTPEEAAEDVSQKISELKKLTLLAEVE